MLSMLGPFWAKLPPSTMLHLTWALAGWHDVLESLLRAEVMLHQALHDLDWHMEQAMTAPCYTETVHLADFMTTRKMLKWTQHAPLHFTDVSPQCCHLQRGRILRNHWLATANHWLATATLQKQFTLWTSAQQRGFNFIQSKRQLSNFIPSWLVSKSHAIKCNPGWLQPSYRDKKTTTRQDSLSWRFVIKTNDFKRCLCTHQANSTKNTYVLQQIYSFFQHVQGWQWRILTISYLSYGWNKGVFSFGGNDSLGQRKAGSAMSTCLWSWRVFFPCACVFEGSRIN